MGVVHHVSISSSCCGVCRCRIAFRVCSIRLCCRPLRDGYGQGPARYDRYAQPPADFEPPYPPRYAGGGPCVPREAVRDRLLSEGWGDFRDFEPRGRVVMVQARRPSGRLFDLTIDRCSGEVVDARPVFGPRVEPGAYAYGGYGGYGYGPRRFWPRPY